MANRPQNIVAAAYAIADSIEHVAEALHKLGVANAATPMGALEHVGLELKNGSDAISSAIGDLAEAIRDA